VAKDTEKLIRQLSLISYLMAERRPVTATEIRRDVEGYSDMTEDAFARRFYADRAELDALGIHLRVDKPADGFSEQENYSLAPEAFHLPAIAFSDDERAALQTALTLLDGEFAYAEPLRLALQQITWGRPSPLGTDSRQTIGLGITASAGGSELSGRLAKVDTAIYRRKRIEFEYYTMQTGETALRKVDPYHLLFEGGQWYLVGHSHERAAVRVFRLSRIRGKVAYSTKAEHDFQRPADFDPRGYANRIPWQLGDVVGTGEVWVSDKIAWYVERQFGATARCATPRMAGASSAPTTRSRDCSSRGRCGSATRRASATRPSSSRSRDGGWTRSSTATAASRSPPSPTGRRPARPCPRARPAGARAAARPASGRSASPAWSRSPRC
jgi:predicted DNA-binding transcriptional regulator YafY